MRRLRARQLPPPTRALGTLCLAAVASCSASHVVGEVAGGAGTVAKAPPPCDMFAAGEVMAVCAATYLSGKGPEPAAAVAIGVDGAVIVAGALGATEFPGATTVSLPGAGNGTLLRLRPDGRAVQSITRLGEAVADVEVEPRTGILAVVGAPFGVAVLSPEATRVLWQRQIQALRVSIGADGTVAVLEGDRAFVSVLDGKGALLGRFALPSGAVGADVAVHARSQTVVVTGRVPAGMTLQPILNAHRYTGEPKWKSYGFTEADISARSLRASTRGIRVVIGADDLLYYLGESHGGNTVHGKNPRDLDVSADLRSQDPYDQPYDTGLYILFWGRFRPEDGRFEGGEYLLTRERGSTKGQSVHPEDLAADDKGNVLVGGNLRCCIQGADRRRLRDVPVPPVTGGDPDAFVMLSSADRRSRLLWTTFGAPAVTTGVAMRGGTAAMVAWQEKAFSDKARLITIDALQPAPGGGGGDTYVAVFPTP